jgi:transcriptional regulator with XRE-family HTH domain
MAKKVFATYEEWDLASVPIPPRSKLYSLKPVGVGTPWVESLTSYVARLAEAHCLYSGVLMHEVVVPQISGYSPLDLQHHLYRRDGHQSNLVNATGIRAMYMIQALEMLTQRSDFRYLTLLPFADVLYIRGLIRPTKAWCPVCYEEWRRAGKVPYDPLLWVLEEVSACAHHHQRLLLRCPYQDCAKFLPPLGWRSRPGYCNYCQRWLGVSQSGAQTANSSLDKSELIWQQWVTEALGTLLAHIPISPYPERQQVINGVIHIIRQIAGGSTITVARTLGMSRSIVSHWYLDQRLPQIGALLRLCYQFNLSLSDLLWKETTELSPCTKDEVLPLRLAKRRSPTPSNRGAIFQALEDILASDEKPPPSLREVAERLKCTDRFLYRCHQTACYEITSRYRAYLQQRKEARMEQNRQEIRQLALELHSRGISLRRRLFEQYLPRPGILRHPGMREFTNEVSCELNQML